MRGKVSAAQHFLLKVLNRCSAGNDLPADCNPKHLVTTLVYQNNEEAICTIQKSMEGHNLMTSEVFSDVCFLYFYP